MRSCSVGQFHGTSLTISAVFLVSPQSELQQLAGQAIQAEAAYGTGQAMTVPGQWMTVPPGYVAAEGVPPGLEVLAMVDGLMIHQQVEKLEAAAQAFGISYESNNKYNISNRVGIQVYQAHEETGFCWRCCCGSLRPAHIKMFDATGHQVLAMKRKFRWLPCAWFECCRETVDVYHGTMETGTIIGQVTQPVCGGCFTPRLNILNAAGEKDLGVKGHFCIGECCGSTFDVEGSDESKVGEVKKLGANSFTEFAKETLTDADRFVINFPQDLKVETKATALMALLVIDFIFYENGGSANAALDGSCTVDCCTMYCCGCPLPCRFTCGGSQPGDDGGDGGAPVSDEIDR
ncbi:unnamed protein product [Discosporangium mesarthrocarpum]